MRKLISISFVATLACSTAFATDNLTNIEFSEFNGIQVQCAGSVTPWETHLGSKEYEPDARTIKDNGDGGEYYNLMSEYFGGDLKKLNPYNYGWSPKRLYLVIQYS